MKIAVDALEFEAATPENTKLVTIKVPNNWDDGTLIFQLVQSHQSKEKTYIEGLIRT